MNTCLSTASRSAFEKILATAMVDVASELRLADPCELMLMIRGEQAANIADLVNSSTELYFKSDALRYALSAAYELKWETTPVSRFDMEFRGGRVCAFFTLVIGCSRAGVELVEVMFEDGGLDAEAQAQRLSAAIQDALLSHS
jgi:hypothetical protein